MMTTRDYEKLAAALGAARDVLHALPRTTSERYVQDAALLVVQTTIEDALRKDNPAFDRAKFRAYIKRFSIRVP